MIAHEFFADPRFGLPRAPTPSTDFLSDLRRMFAKHAELLREAKGSSDTLVQNIVQGSRQSRRLAEQVLRAVEEHLAGHPALCFATLKSAIEPFRSEFDALNIAGSASSHPLTFRLRVDEHPTRLLAADLFHIPFELRHKVASQRYSIPGVPSLYLGNSALVCWVEMGRPDLAKICGAVVRMAPGTSFNVLNFGWAPWNLGRLLKEPMAKWPHWLATYAIAYAKCWPLIAACSWRTRHPDAAFKPEYIVPQTLLQWVQQDGKVDGIAYFSTHHERGADIAPMINWVFPTKASAKQTRGHCYRLKARFQVSAPLAWTTFTITQRLLSHIDNKNIGIACIQPGVFDDYGATELYCYENLLLSLDKNCLQ